MGVTPCAWVKLDMEGYVVYTSNMYSTGGDHVYLYENETAAEDDTYHSNCELSIVFYPRILGRDTVDDELTTTVDISSKADMTIYIFKDKSTYAADKKIYLNDVELQPTFTDDYNNLLSLTFENVPFVRGNPNGKINGFVNVIEYR